MLAGMFALLVIDFFLLYTSSKLKIKAKRTTPERLSNGDVNEIFFYVKSNYNFKIKISVIDEIPHQFQKRDFEIKATLAAQAEKTFLYKLRPVRRGEYVFGRMNVYTSSPVGFIQRRDIFDEGAEVPVYPSYIQMRKFELLAISDRLTEAGIKKIRKISNNNEFEQIREYVPGDDIRTINWKAVAKRGKLMTNQFQDEKSQQVFSIIDKGRSMKMPFDELSLLDYAINASLVISNIAMHKHDKAGLITYSKEVDSIVPAARKASQMNLIMEVLYKQKTNFEESNLELVYAAIRRKVRQRSLLLLYTNFEGISSMRRQLSFFKRMAKSHLTVVIFFENTELHEITDSHPKTTDEIYIKTVAEKFAYEKKLIVKELNSNGIHSILTAPEDLTVNTINKYLEFKAKGMI